MKCKQIGSFRITWRAVALSLLPLLWGTSATYAQFVIPGTGHRIAFDDFEDEQWEFTPNFPKSSKNIDGRIRAPLGFSNNQLWIESTKRGEPDIIQRVPTPAGGLPGSHGALLLKSLYTGIPDRTSIKSQQDDLLMRMSSQTGGYVSVARSPSVVVRVYLPPFDEWEDSTDTSFGFRADVVGSKWEQKKRGFLFIRRRKLVSQTYWPGMFIQFNSKTDRQYDKDFAVFIIRGDDSGRDFVGPTITQTGWWTLGMSFTPDGRVHYFASPGVDRLTAADHIASHAPYYSRCQRFNTVFFNICNQNNGKTPSTSWIIDDPELYVVR